MIQNTFKGVITKEHHSYPLKVSSARNRRGQEQEVIIAQKYREHQHGDILIIMSEIFSIAEVRNNIGDDLDL